MKASVGHALAALCLHEQPFGFTREDVELLQSLDHSYLASYIDYKEDGYANLASRIEALLPPEDDDRC